MKVSQSIGSQPENANASLVPSSWNNYGLNITDSLYADYYAYTFEAHHKIAQCKKVVDRWTNKYQKYQKRRNSNDITSCNSDTKKSSNSSQKVQIIKQILEEMENGLSNSGGLSSPVSASENGSENRNKLHDSLQSIGESSGYESFRYRPDEDEQSEGSETINSSKVEDISSSNCMGRSSASVGEPWKVSSRKIEDTYILESAEDLFTAGTVNLGELPSFV